ncbi:MAG: Amino-acid acetyltransferase, partial [Pseudomonadota bacterium]
MSLGQAIRQQRKNLKCTLQSLAVQIGTDAGNLSRVERGTQGLSEQMLLKLCKALNCTPAFLYEQSDQFNTLDTSNNIANYANSVNSAIQNTQNLSKPQEFVSWF